jgi:hypothetical protein
MQDNTWEQRTTVKKGNTGQDLVDRYLRSKGIVPYAPTAEGAHPFDRLCATGDKKRLFIAEVKTKARRNYYPDTGIDLTHYRGYADIAKKHTISVCLFFVDELVGSIYGNTLAKLEEERLIEYQGKLLKYPMVLGKIIYFPLEAMVTVCGLDGDSIENLRQLSTRSYEYKTS